MREMSVKLTPIDLLSVKLTHSQWLVGIYPAMRNPDKTFETLLYENFDGTVTHTSCSPGMDPKTYPAYEEENRVNTIERRFQQLANAQ